MTLQKGHKNLAGISEGAILVTADVVDLCSAAASGYSHSQGFWGKR